jgi:uncharacterized protein
MRVAPRRAWLHIQASGERFSKAAASMRVKAQSEMPAAQTEWAVFQRSPIHGVGGFARKEVPAGTRILEYVGRRIDKRESLWQCQQNNEYLFTLNDQEDLDGNVPWNPARFINHSCAPNCDALLEKERIWLVANRCLKAGEEITFNYGFDLADYREYPCRCGAPDCVGYIVAEEFFAHVRRQAPAQ